MAEPVGRLYVARWSDEIRIVDIALLPAFCNRGLGTTLVRALQAEAAARTRASRCASTSNASIPRCGSTSASGSDRSRIKACICSWNGG